MICLVADIHSSRSRLEKLERKIKRRFGRSLREGDVLVVCGDLLGSRSSKDAKKRKKMPKAQRRCHPRKPFKTEDYDFIEYLKGKPYTMAVVYGNHDPEHRIKLISEPDELFGAPVRRILENLVFLENGRVYDIEDAGGGSARILSQGHALGHCPRFMESREYFNEKRYLKNNPDEEIEVDFVLSHDAPSSKMGVFAAIYGHNKHNDALDKVMEKTVFKHWFFGHHHLDWKTDEKFDCIYSRVVRLA